MVIRMILLDTSKISSCRKIITVFLFLFSSFCSSAQVTVEFSGTLEYVDTELQSDFSISQLLSGSYIYDDSITDYFPSNHEIGRYYSITDVTIEIGSYVWRKSQPSGNGSIQINDRDPTLTHPTDESYMIFNQGFTSLNYVNQNLLFFDIINDPLINSNYFSGDGLSEPKIPAQMNRARLSFYNSGDNLQMHARLSKFSAAKSVPEPSGLVLFIISYFILTFVLRSNIITTN